MHLRRDGILSHGYPGCHAALVGTSCHGHSEQSCNRIEEAIRSAPGGQARVSRQKEKDIEKMAVKIEQEDEKHSHMNKKRKTKNKDRHKLRFVEDRGEKR